MGSESVVLFYVNGASTAPEEVEADAPGEWPGFDRKGRPIFANSHYKTRAEAWVHLERDVEAQQSLAVRAMQEADEQARMAVREVADATMRAVAIRQARERAP